MGFATRVPRKLAFGIVAVALFGGSLAFTSATANAATYDTTNPCKNLPGPDVWDYQTTQGVFDGAKAYGVIRLYVAPYTYLEGGTIIGEWCANVAFLDGFAPTTAAVRVSAISTGATDFSSGTTGGNTPAAYVKSGECVQVEGWIKKGTTVDAHDVFNFCWKDTDVFARIPAYKASAIKWAYSERGTPYVWGGQSASGFDCSGLVIWSYAKTGHRLIPAGTDMTADNLDAKFPDTSRPEPGDLVFFVNSVGHTFHVGIYIGRGEMVVASSSQGVTVQSIYVINASKIRFGRI